MGYRPTPNVYCKHLPQTSVVSCVKKGINPTSVFDMRDVSQPFCTASASLQCLLCQPLRCPHCTATNTPSITLGSIKMSFGPLRSASSVLVSWPLRPIPVPLCMQIEQFNGLYPKHTMVKRGSVLATRTPSIFRHTTPLPQERSREAYYTGAAPFAAT